MHLWLPLLLAGIVPTQYFYYDVHSKTGGNYDNKEKGEKWKDLIKKAGRKQTL